MSRRVLILFLFVTGFQSAFAQKVSIQKDISYTTGSDSGTAKLLDVYYTETGAPKDVLVFVHGGSWNSGKKDTYWWLGRNMARKGVVAVIINYSLSPDSQYEKMAADCAEALKWVSDSISKFGGNARRIYVMGHSAGGHLAALINNDPRFFKQLNIPNPIHGLILNDAFGLDMFEYLSSAVDNAQTKSFLNTFSEDKAIWKTGSPMSYLKEVKNPFLILVGERTYPAIQLQSDRLYKQFQSAGKPAEFRIIPDKKHIGMISQMIFSGNVMYKYVLGFMKKY
jgi:acetyl esterase/lipase